LNRVTDYDSVAAGYDVRYRNYDYGEIKNALYSFLGAETAPRVLEVGCGTGYWLRAIADPGPHRTAPSLVVGLDRSEGMIVRAKGSGAPLVRAAAEQLPLAGESFDRIACINALHHFSDRDRFFEECRRTLKPHGGVFAVGLDPHAERDSWWIYDYFPETRGIDRVRYPAVRTIRAEVIGAGFTRTESWEVQVFEHAMPAQRAFDRGLVDRSFSSQLTVLSDEEFDAGVARIREAMKEAEQRGDELQLISELHLYAVTGWV
jgi:SAM-dependent methyltransferase